MLFCSTSISIENKFSKNKNVNTLTVLFTIREEKKNNSAALEVVLTRGYLKNCRAEVYVLPTYLTIGVRCTV